MGLVDHLFGRSAVAQWLSDHTIVAARTLTQVAADLIRESDALVKEADWQSAILSPADFVTSTIAPMVRETSEPVAVAILEDANRDLARIAQHQAVWTRSPNQDAGKANDYGAFFDVATAAGPIAAGVATAAAIPMAAVSTVTSGIAWLGLGVTSTVISWPVVVGGGALAGLGIATGAFNGARLQDKIYSRLRTRAREYITASLLGGDEANPSILIQLTTQFERVAEAARHQ